MNKDDHWYHWFCNVSAGPCRAMTRLAQGRKPNIGLVIQASQDGGVFRSFSERQLQQSRPETQRFISDMGKTGMKLMFPRYTRYKATTQTWRLRTKWMLNLLACLRIIDWAPNTLTGQLRDIHLPCIMSLRTSKVKIIILNYTSLLPCPKSPWYLCLLQGEKQGETIHSIFCSSNQYLFFWGKAGHRRNIPIQTIGLSGRWR